MSIVCFVILHYKDIDCTDQCVRSILKMKQAERIRIVIVDNDIKEPEEKRKEIIMHYRDIPNITVLTMREDRGFSFANNEGYFYAKKKLGASCIVVLNNDIEFVQVDFIEKLEKIYKKQQCEILGPDIIRRSTGEHQNPMDNRIRTEQEAELTIRMNRIALRFYSVLYPLLYWKYAADRKRKLLKKKKRFFNNRNSQEQIVLFGACLIFMSGFVEKEDRAFWPETYFYYEEYLLAYRCLKKNYRAVFAPSLVAMHESGAATRKRLGSEKKKLKFIMEQTMKSCEIYLKYIRDN